MERLEELRRAAVVRVDAWLGANKWAAAQAARWRLSTETLVDGAAALFAAAALLAATVLVWKLLTLLLFGRRRRQQQQKQQQQQNARSLVALLGLQNAGKTALFLQLRDGAAADTHPSQQPNDTTALAQFPRGAVRLVDCPGHPRVRDAWLQQQLAPAATMGKAALVFVVNAVDFAAEAPHVADLLFRVLLLAHPPPAPPPVLVFCNKADLATALAPAQIAAVLERELQQLRETERAAAAAGDAVPDIVKPGKEDEPFVFANAVSPVTFASGSARTGQIEPVTVFIRSHCRL